MEALLYLIPIALILGVLGLIAFLWSLKAGQYDDLDGAALRILDDSDIEEVKELDRKEREKTNSKNKDIG